MPTTEVQLRTINEDIMKKSNLGAASVERRGYEAPDMEVVEISVERGFEVSSESGFEGPSYDEEDIIW